MLGADTDLDYLDDDMDSYDSDIDIIKERS